MGCNNGCMTKVKKVFALPYKSINANQVGTNYRILIHIIDYIPLRDLIRMGRTSR